MAMIRMAGTADARGLAEVRVRGWQVGYEGIVNARFLAAMSIDQNEARWREIVDARCEVIRVATLDGHVVGFASYGPYRTTAIDTELVESEAVGELYGFYVHPDSWGTGVANELHVDAIDRLRASGWRRSSSGYWPTTLVRGASTNATDGRPKAQASR